VVIFRGILGRDLLGYFREGFVGIVQGGIK